MLRAESLKQPPRASVTMPALPVVQQLPAALHDMV